MGLTRVVIHHILLDGISYEIINEILTLKKMRDLNEFLAIRVDLVMKQKKNELIQLAAPFRHPSNKLNGILIGSTSLHTFV